MRKWEMVKLGEVYSIKKGTKVEPIAQGDDAIRFIQIDDLRNNYNIKLCNKEKSYTYANSNDIIIAWDGANAGTIGYGISGAIGSTLALLHCENKEILTSYVGIFLQGKFRYLRDNCTGATIPHINRNALENIEIPLPPIETQQKIADALDKASSLIELRKVQIEKLDLLVKAKFIDMFGDLGLNKMKWNVQSLESVCSSKDDIKCGPFGTQLIKNEYQKYGIPIWGIPQINSAFKIQPTDFLTEEKANALKQYSITSNDIAMSRKGNVGKCAVYPAHYPDGIIHSDVLRIRVDRQKANSIYLMHQLHISPRIQIQIELVSSGAIMAGINVTKLKKIYIHTPPIALQNQFAEFVEQVEQQKALLQQGLEKLELNYKSLMQKCFNGSIF